MKQNISQKGYEVIEFFLFLLAVGEIIGCLYMDGNN